MSEFINILPDIILYVVSGFFFMQIFRITYAHKPSNDILFSSVITGYIIVNFLKLIPFSINNTIDSIAIVLWSIVLGYLLGRIMDSQKLTNLLDTLHIGTTFHSYFWDDVIDYDYPSKMRIMVGGKIYEGTIRLVEEETSIPKVMLVNYSVDGVKYGSNQAIILDVSKADEIIIEYDEESPKIAFIN